MWRPFLSKIALVTGGSNGIGKAIAQAFIKEGITVYIGDITEPNIEGAKFISLDVSQEADWKRARDEIKQLDILVNNAGITGAGTDLGPLNPEHMSLESWNKIHSINLNGVFLGCKYGIRMMKRNGGSIINMSSILGMVGVPNLAAYASSKAAVRNHTKSVALYCSEKGYQVRCNSILPGAIETPIWDPLGGIDTVIPNIPLKRFGTTDEVAKAVLYLSSDASSYSNGSELILDGGVLAKSTIT